MKKGIYFREFGANFATTPKHAMELTVLPYS
jgi:hypothetical protein